MASAVLAMGTTAHAEPLLDRGDLPPYLGGASPSASFSAHLGRVLHYLPPGAPSTGLRWLEGFDLTPPWLCEFSSDCIDDYLAFPTLALEYASLDSADELDERLVRASKTTREAEPSSPAELETIVREALGVGFLFDGAETVPLEVTHLASVRNQRFLQHWLLLHDPWVGTFPVRVLAPADVDISHPGDHPAILFLTGHLDTANSLLEEYDGLGFVDAGYTVVTIEARADDAGPVENLASRYLMVNGFTMMGLRVYEALLGLRFLQSLPGVDPTRVGLLGHSGGAAIVNATVRLHPAFAAAVIDHQGEHYSLADERYVLCETVLGLVGYDAILSDPSTSPVPMKRVEYGWPEGAGTVTRFFDRYLLSGGGNEE